MRVIGVTGTDTDVGKTQVTAAIALALRGAGARVAAVKPVASGVPTGTVAGDAAVLADAAGHEPRVYASFVTPISPHRAAALAGVSVPRAALSAWIRSFSADVVLVEGAGGLRSPLGDDSGWYYLDDLPIDALIGVAPNRLGVLSQAGLMLRGARHPWVGLVINDGVGDPGDPSRAFNPEDLATLAAALAAPTVRVDAGTPRALAPAFGAWAQGLLARQWPPR
jgi:dethiobiotin synthetase